MKAHSRPRLRFIGYAFAALLCACGASSVPRIDAGNDAEQSQAHTHKQTFIYTGREQRFVVPTGVTALTIVAYGAAGGGDKTTRIYSLKPGYGGEVSAVVPVQPGERLSVFVGGEGTRHNGYNGGGQGGSSQSYLPKGYDGGGASDVRQGGDRLRDRIVVAGGGGGAGGGEYFSGAGGLGGGTTGGSGCCSHTTGLNGAGGSGGTKKTGGAGGAGGGAGQHAGQPGAPGLRGSGGDGGASGGHGSGYFSGWGGGGGGGGYYGGGGGGGGGPDNTHSSGGGGWGGGGGGGSSFVESKARKLKDKQGVSSSDGSVIVRW